MIGDPGNKVRRGCRIGHTAEVSEDFLTVDRDRPTVTDKADAERFGKSDLLVENKIKLRRSAYGVQLCAERFRCGGGPDREGGHD